MYEEKNMLIRSIIAGLNHCYYQYVDITSYVKLFISPNNNQNVSSYFFLFSALKMGVLIICSWFNILQHKWTLAHQNHQQLKHIATVLFAGWLWKSNFISIELIHFVTAIAKLQGASNVIVLHPRLNCIDVVGCTNGWSV